MPGNKRRAFVTRIAPALAMALVLALAAVPRHAVARDAESWTLQASDWSRPRSGETVLAMTPLMEAVRAWQAASRRPGGAGARLLLVYPGGEDGSLWVAELRDWLVALGMPPRALDLAPGNLPADELELRLLGAGND